MKAHDKRLADCQQVIGYHFSISRLLETALTHSSLRTPDRECNERLEFLGDSVLGMVITEELYHLLPDQSEGELTRIKSAVVSRSALLVTSQRLGLARFAEFARGVGRRDTLPASVVANLVEAIIGAIYLDAGYYPAREFVLRHMGAAIDDELNDRGAKNYKSLLQHEVQQAIGVTPTYRTVESDGPDHAREFIVAAVIRGQEWGRAGGSTKKEAEQEAAHLALEAWNRRGRGRRRSRGSEPEASDAPDTTVPTDDEGAADAFEIAAATEGPSRPRRKKRARRSRRSEPAKDAVTPNEDAPKAAATDDTPEAAPEKAQAASKDTPAPRKRLRRRRRRGDGPESASGPEPAAEPERKPRRTRARKAEAPAADATPDAASEPERKPRRARARKAEAPAPKEPAREELAAAEADPAPAAAAPRADRPAREPRRRRRRSREAPPEAAAAEAPAATTRNEAAPKEPAPKKAAPPKAAPPKAAPPKAAAAAAKPERAATPKKAEKPKRARTATAFGAGIKNASTDDSGAPKPPKVKKAKVSAPAKASAPTVKKKKSAGGFGSGI